MNPELEVLPDAEAVAARAAAFVADRVRAAARDGRRFALAVSGGRTPGRMFALLADLDVPWEAIAMWQVDERVAPPDDPERNLTHLLESLGEATVVELHPMPVEHDDLEQAAAAYAADLPPAFDLVHLGLGADGHTASLFPGDPAAEVTDRDVALTGEHLGHRRMTLTLPVLDRAGELLWVVTGHEKAAALAGLLAHDPAIPAGRPAARRQTVLADRAAAPDAGLT